MTISAVALFGSHARNDAEPGSDVDILAITAERTTRHVEMGAVSLYLYPWRNLLAGARAGNLFICHIVKEARQLHDPQARLTALSDAFRFKPSYEEDIRKASDLGWYLTDSATDVHFRSANRRIAWCVRTILIAHSAEVRQPVFAASALAAFSGSKAARSLINRKDDRTVAEDSPELLRSFLENFGKSRPPVTSDAEFRDYFQDSGNQVAMQTLRSRDNDSYALVG